MEELFYQLLTTYCIFLLQNIKDGLDGRPARWYQDVYELVFNDLDKDRAAKLWGEQLKEEEGKRKKRDDEDDD